MRSQKTTVTSTPVTLFRTVPGSRSVLFENAIDSPDTAYFSLNNNAVLSSANGTAVTPGTSVKKDLDPSSYEYDVQAISASTSYVTAQSFPF